MRTVLYLIITLVLQQSIYSQKNDYLFQIGKIDSLYSKTLNENREIYIHFPEGYQSNSNTKYPVLYVLDGEMFLPTVADVQRYYSGGFTPEMIVVGISNANNRTRDLTTSKITTKYEMPFNVDNGEAQNFLTFISTELIPYVESKYAVTNYRTLIGHSYGGLFAIYTLVHQSELFANYLSIDPSLDWDNQQLLKQTETVISKADFKNKALYMSLSGQLHMQNYDITIDNVMQDTSDYTLFARSNIGLSQFIEQNTSSGLFFKWQFYPDDLHGTIPQPCIKDGLIALFEWYQMENTDAINNPETSKDELISIIKHREEKLNSHFGYSVPPYPEELLTMSGYMNLDIQQLDKSKMYFEYAIKYYPESANTYDSLADYYEAQENFKEALKYVTKAYEISKSEYHKERIDKLKNM